MMNRLLLGCLAVALVSVGACSSDDSSSAPDAAGGGSPEAGRDAARPDGSIGGPVGGSSGAGGGRVDSGREASADAARLDDGAADAADGSDGRSVCLTAPYSNVTTFGAIFDGWVVASGGTTPTLVPMPGVGPDGGFVGTVVELDTSDGSPTPGSAKLTIPFSEFNQNLTFAKNFSTGVNMSGATVTAQIKLDSGLISGPTDIGEAFLVVKSTGAYLYAPSASIILDPTAGWKTLTLKVDAPSPDVPAGYTPCDIREIDVIITTGQTGSYRTAIVHIDTIAISGPGSADAATPPAEASTTDAADTGSDAAETGTAADTGADTADTATSAPDAADATPETGN